MLSKITRHVRILLTAFGSKRGRLAWEVAIEVRVYCAGGSTWREKDFDLFFWTAATAPRGDWNA